MTLNPPQYTEEQVAEVVRRYRAGGAIRAIAREMGLPYQTIRHWCRDGGRRREVRYHSDETVIAAFDLYTEGLPVADIATQLGVPFSTVYGWIYRPRGRRKIRPDFTPRRGIGSRAYVDARGNIYRTINGTLKRTQEGQ